MNGLGDERVPRQIRRDGDYVRFYGQSGDGRLLLMVGEQVEGGWRIFSARDMNGREKREFRGK